MTIKIANSRDLKEAIAFIWVLLGENFCCFFFSICSFLFVVERRERVGDWEGAQNTEE